MARSLTSRHRWTTIIITAAAALLVLAFQWTALRGTQLTYGGDHRTPYEQQVTSTPQSPALGALSTVPLAPSEVVLVTVKQPQGSQLPQTNVAAVSDRPPSPACPAGKLLEFPMSGLEQELERLGSITAEVMRDVGATYWPTDGTLLGLMRNGRVSTDRDLDYQIHSTYDECSALLGSLKGFFEKRARVKSFKVAKIKHNGKKIGRYAMVRLHRAFGTFDTGPDFNCVYMDDPQVPRYFTHRAALVPVPPTVYPLGWCLMYGKAVPCPRDGMAVLASLKPRYDGCMVFPHCLGDPSHFSKKCMSPHPVFPLQRFVDSTAALADCGFTALRDHFHNEPSCAAVLQGTQKHCETIGGSDICFLQKYDG